MLRARGSQQVVHLGVRSVMFTRVCLWISPGGLAIRGCGDYLVWRGSASMVALGTTKLTHHFVYILQSLDGKYYVGYTTDINRRMEQHRTGKGAKFTRGFGFRKLLYHESLPSKSGALKREAELKGWTHAEKKALCRGAC